MSTKMGFWRWALASAAILIATGTAGARVIDPTGVTTDGAGGDHAISATEGRPRTPVRASWALQPDAGHRLRLRRDDCRGCVRPASAPRAERQRACTDADCPGAAVDTIVQLTNTSEFLTKVLCFYTNTNSHCSNSPETICTDANFRDRVPAGGLCVPGWVETDFHLHADQAPAALLVGQQRSVRAAAGRHAGPGHAAAVQRGHDPARPRSPVHRRAALHPARHRHRAAERPQRLQGRGDDRHDDRSTNIDVDKYNAIGIKAIEGRQTGAANVLNIGGPDAEYGVFNETVDPPRFVGCPNILTLNHFFDGANVITHEESVQGQVNSDLTIVPCERDYLFQTANGLGTTVQFLIFNEFEQRFSTSTKVSCYKEIRLSDIDTRPGPEGDAFSIFSVGVQGTLTGMSRLRSVPGPNVDGYDGRTHPRRC